MHALLKRRTRILDISRFYNIEHDEIDQKKLKLYFNKTEKKKKSYDREHFHMCKGKDCV